MSERQSGFTPPPEVGPRLRIDRNGNYVDEFGRRVDDRSTTHAPVSISSARAFAELVAMYVVDKVQKNIANLIQTAQETMLSDNLFCAICSHDDCKHFHQLDDYSVADLVEYLGVEKSTVYTWLYHQRITRPVSENPHLWDPHVIACFKHDKKIVFSSPQYDQAEHQRLLVMGHAEHEKKRKVKSAKLSAHMVRENARRRATKRRSQPTRKSTHTRTPRSRKR